MMFLRARRKIGRPGIGLSRRPFAAALMACTALTGCHWDMWDGARLKPLEGSTFPPFEGQSSRYLVAGTIPWNSDPLNTKLREGKENGVLATTLPEGLKLDRALLERGQERFNIYCMPCHGQTGHGDGMVVQRGFPPPPSYHEDPRLLEAPLGYFVAVMTNGFGRMYSYASRIPAEDRWRIAAYIRTLQLSQHAAQQLLPDDLLEQLRNLEPEDQGSEEVQGSDERH